MGSVSFAIYQLDCPSCGARYAHVLPDGPEHGVLLCPSCEAHLEVGPRLSAKDLLACGITAGGG